MIVVMLHAHIQIKEHLGGKIYELCQEKLKEFNLTKDPDFLWCANVSLLKIVTAIGCGYAPIIPRQRIFL